MAQQDAQNGMSKNVAIAAAVSFVAVKLQLLVEALKANDTVLFYKAAFAVEEVGHSLNPKRKAEHELPLILSIELKIADSSFLIADLIDDSASPTKAEGNALLEKLHQKWSSVEKQPYPAMYSSIYGGITLDPGMMLIPIDDHMVHRGHGVFDTGIVLDGYLYELDGHIDRLLRSASKAKISYPFSWSTLRSFLIQLAAASKCKKGTLRYRLTAGLGSFLVETEDVEGAIEKTVSTGAVAEGEVAEGEGACCGGRVGRVKDLYGFVRLFCSPKKKCADVEA